MSLDALSVSDTIPAEPQPDPGVVREGTTVHQTELVINDHRIWLQDDTDAATAWEDTAAQIGAALVENGNWRPRVQAIAQRALDLIAGALDASDTFQGAAADKMRRKLAIAETVLEPLSELEG